MYICMFRYIILYYLILSYIIPYKFTLCKIISYLRIFLGNPFPEIRSIPFHQQIRSGPFHSVP